MAYEIDYGPIAFADIESLRAYDRAQVLEAVEKFLRHEPARESKSRIKRMTQPFWCQFRLRVGEFRVYYVVDESAVRVGVVRILLKGSNPTPAEEP